MAIRLVQSDTLILLPPKIGSNWIRRALRAGGVLTREEGPAEWRGHGGLDVNGGGAAFIATFVRGPVSWYRSYWAYRHERGWRPHYALDRICAAERFGDFIRKVVIELPGFLGAMLERYSGPPENPVDFVGHQERLADDLVELLRVRGDEFDETALRSMPPLNTTTTKPALDDWLVDAIHVSEQSMAERYGYAWADPIGLKDVQRRYPEDIEDLRKLVLWTERIHWSVDDVKRARDPVELTRTRHARCLGNFGLYAQYVKGDMDFAGQCYTAALERAPTHPRTLANFAVYCADHLRRYDDAEALLRRALHHRPGHLHSLRILERLLELQGRRADAEECSRRLRLLVGTEETLHSEAPFLFGARE